MIKQGLITLLMVVVTMSNLSAQKEYNVVEGPSYFMRLNDAGNDFDEVEINTSEQGYTFYNSYWDMECPWSVVSEGGTNIYTKLNLGKASSFMDLFLVSPDVELSTDLMYTFSQEVFGIANETEVPGCIAKLELKMVRGNADDFHPDSLKTLSSLAFKIYRETGDEVFEVKEIVPELAGSHYFVLYVSYYGTYNGNTTGMSLGFKRNTVSDNSTTGLSMPRVSDLKIYPNPTNGMLSIKGGQGGIEVRDILGNIIYESLDYNGQILDLSHLKTGVYLVGNKGDFVRFVKN